MRDTSSDTSTTNALCLQHTAAWWVAYLKLRRRSSSHGLGHAGE